MFKPDEKNLPQNVRYRDLTIVHGAKTATSRNCDTGEEALAVVQRLLQNGTPEGDILIDRISTKNINMSVEKFKQSFFGRIGTSWQFNNDTNGWLHFIYAPESGKMEDYWVKASLPRSKDGKFKVISSLRCFINAEVDKQKMENLGKEYDRKGIIHKVLNAMVKSHDDKLLDEPPYGVTEIATFVLY